MRMIVRVRVVLFVLTAILGARTQALTVSWEFPRTGSCHEGLPFSDGVTGVLVWGGGDTLNLTVGRADLWDHRGGYDWEPSQSYSNIVALVRAGRRDGLLELFKKESPPDWGGRYNPYLLPLGRVVVRIPGATVASGELDTSTGLGRLFLSDGRAVELAMSKADRVFALRTPKGLKAVIDVKPATDFPVYGRTLRGRGFEKARRTADGFTWRLPADEPVSLACERRPDADGEALYVRTWRGESVAARRSVPASFADVVAESAARWRTFWREGARVVVPDPVLQRVFDYGMYRFGAMTDPDGVPAGLQGPWLEDDRLVPWNGDYHFNINVQECYSPAFRGGHFDHLRPLFRMVLGWRPRLRENARRFCGIEDGYAMPHSVDDRGVCIGGFWSGTIDHASTAWMAALMYRYVSYSGDIAMLKDGIFDFMRGAMNVYRAMMEEYDGRLSLPVGPSPEWGGSDPAHCVGRDPSFQLAAAHRLASDMIEAAGLLGEAPDPMWLDVRKRLPRYTAKEGVGLQLFEGVSLTESHRHHSHLAGYYPFDVIGLAENPQLAFESRRTWMAQGTGQWSGWCVPWASILYTHFGDAPAAVHMLQSWDRFFCNPGHGSLHNAYRPGFTAMTSEVAFATPVTGQIMQMDGQCAAATAVMELLVHEVNGKLEFFRGCPPEWKDVRFENVAVRGGRRISGRRVNGVVTVEDVGGRK